MLEEYGSTEGNVIADLQSKIRLTLGNLLIIVGRMHIANQGAVFEISWEVEWFVKLLHD